MNADLDLINLTPYTFSPEKIEVLKLGLSFCPMNLDKYETIKDIYLLSRNLTYKYLFDGDRLRAIQDKRISEQVKNFTMEDFRALMLLLDENVSDASTPDSAASETAASYVPQQKKCKPKTQRFPDLMSNSNIWAFFF